MAINFDKAQALKEALSIIDNGTEKAALTVYNGNPNGNVTATVGALCIDYSGSGKLWKNTTGSTAWTELGTGGGSGHVIEDEGTPVAQQTNLNFVGAGVTVTDSGGKTVVTIPGSSGNLRTTFLVYTTTPSADNEYSDFATLHTAALALVADGFTVEIKLLQNLTISTGNDWDFTGMIFIGNGSVVSPIEFVVEDTTGTQATFELTAVSATPGDYLEHYVSLYDDENTLSYIWFDTTGADPEPPAIISATEVKVRVDVQAIAVVDDVAIAIQTAVTGDTYLNDKFTVVPTAAVAAFTLNFNGVSTLPVSSTANITVGSFVNGVLGTTLLPTTTLHLRNVAFAFKDYNTQRAWKVNSNTTPAVMIIQAAFQAAILYSYANSINCAIAPIEIFDNSQLYVILDGLATYLNISNNNFIRINGGNLALFPENSVFGYGPGNNITGSFGTVYVRMGRYFPQTRRDALAFGSFTGGITSDLYQFFHIDDVQGMPGLTSPGSVLLDGGNGEVIEDSSENIVGIGKVYLYSDSNVDISTLDITVTIDGVLISSESKVYLGNQTDPKENGVYNVTDTAPATPGYGAAGLLYRIIGGNTYTGKWVKNTNIGTINYGTDDVTQEIVQVGKPITVTGTGTQPANLLLSSVFIVEPTGNITVDMSNPTPGLTYAFTMKQGATPYTIGFTQTIKWKGGVVFIATAVANAIDIVTIFYDGVNFYGNFGEDYS